MKIDYRVNTPVVKDHPTFSTIKVGTWFQMYAGEQYGVYCKLNATEYSYIGEDNVISDAAPWECIGANVYPCKVRLSMILSTTYEETR